MDYMDKYNEWLISPVIDEDTKNELRNIQDDAKEIEDRFFKDLEFGTGGLRGIIGAGSNRMNKYTVGKATQGLANYIKMQGKEAMDRGVAIAYDSRRRSKEFATDTALVLNANGIKAYIYSELEPTPILSFTVRHLGTIAGIVITASHNPPAYNGYKVYWEDGGQVTNNKDNEIIEQVNNIKSFDEIRRMDEKDASASGLFNIVDEEVIDIYISEVKALSVNGDIIKKVADDLKIIYTPLHGTGNKPVRRVLSELGFKHVMVVPEQELPDSEFPTVAYPNPEEKDAFTLAIEMAKKENADVIIGTDPDCDRVGVVVKDKSGEYVVLTGNQTGSLLVDYYLGALKSKNMLPKTGVVIKTVVTSELGGEIAKNYGIHVADTLTGFKFICGKIKEFEETTDKKFVFGYEESYGYLAGDFVRDKDGVISSMLVCEMVAYYKSKGMTLYDALEDLWSRYGYYREELKSISMTGKEGMDRINELMSGLRNNPPAEIAGMDVVRIEDFKKSVDREVKTGNTKPIDLPKSNVLKYRLKDSSWFAIRPSGTEPKIKLYFSVIGSDYKDGENKMNKLLKDVLNRVK